MIIPNIQLEINANMVAWYGAIVSSAGIILGIMNFFRDRAKVVIEWNIRQMINPSPGYKSKTDYIVIDVINKGRRPITIGNVGFIALFGKDVIASDSLIYPPRKINEGERQNYSLEKNLVDVNDIAYFYALDLTRKMYRKRVAPVWKIIICFFRKRWQKIKF